MTKSRAELLRKAKASLYKMARSGNPEKTKDMTDADIDRIIDEVRREKKTAASARPNRPRR